MKTLVATTALAIGLLSATSVSARVLGVDVYAGDGTVNWSTAKGAGIVFGFAKATEGTGYHDGNFAANMNNGKAAGVYMGCYHFARPASHTPSAEANYFWNYAGPYIKADGKTLMPVLDIEDFSGHYGASSIADWCDQWCDNVKSIAASHGITVVPIIYISTCSTTYLNSSDNWTGAWLANYNGESWSTGTPWDANCSKNQIWGSGVWDFWQFTSSAYVPGVPGNQYGQCDEDVFNGSTSQLVSGYVVPAPYFDVTLKPCPIQYPDGVEVVFAGQNNGSAPWWSHNNGVSTPWTSGWLGDGYQKINSDVVPVLNANGYMEIFAIDNSTGYLRHKSNTGEGTSWSGWSTIGGGSDGFVGNPAAICRPDGGVEIFVHSSVDHTVTHFFHGSFTDPWTEGTLGGDFGSDPTVVINANNYMEVFATDYNGNLVHCWNTGPGTGWTGWSTLGSGARGRPSAIVRSDGGVEVFVRHTDSSMDHYTHSSFGATWNASSLGGSGFASNPCAIQNPNTHMEVFCNCSDGTLWHNWNQGTGTGWNGWAHLSTGGTLLTSDLGVFINKNGETEVFGRQASDYQVGHLWNSSNGWSNWGLVGGGPG